MAAATQNHQSPTRLSVVSVKSVNLKSTERAQIQAPKPVDDFALLKKRSLRGVFKAGNKNNIRALEQLEPVKRNDADLDDDARLIGFGQILES